MKKFGLIGFPLTHSFSEKYFKEKFAEEKIAGCTYLNFPLQSIDELPSLLKNNTELAGLNVTIPYKESVMQYLDETDEAAKQAGAVNTIKITRHPVTASSKLSGYNTDIFGFEQSLKPLLGGHHKKALVLGSGGAAKAVGYVLQKLGIEFQIISRTRRDAKFFVSAYKDLNKKVILEHTLIINTTPLGMFPDIDNCPDIPYQFISGKHLLFDLIYNPGETLFLKKGKERGAKTCNGMEMLNLQAEKAWEIWNDSNYK